MQEFFLNFNPLVQTMFGTGFSWGMTALGAAVIFTRRELSSKLLDWMLGFAAGVMIAASYWSLLAPALDMSQDRAVPVWFPAAVGFLVGGIFLRGVDKVVPHPSPPPAWGRSAWPTVTTWPGRWSLRC